MRKKITLLFAHLLLPGLYGCLEPESSPHADAGPDGNGDSGIQCPDPADPEVRYIEGSQEDPSVCHAINVECGAEQTYIPWECGCGCIGPETVLPECPDPNDPAVEYFANSYEDPSVCDGVLFEQLEPDQSPIPPECGCGIVWLDPEQVCPTLDEQDCRFASTCTGGYTGRCDCTCPGPPGYEGGGCEHCSEDCFDFVACVARPTDPCSHLTESMCIAHDACEPGYSGRCDCTCPGPEGYEGGGCEGCEPECFDYVACL